jgi:lipoprotein-anchoring transpeptidase ErfK/SrfK
VPETRRIASLGALIAVTGVLAGVTWQVGTPDTRFAPVAFAPAVPVVAVPPATKGPPPAPPTPLPAAKAPKDLPVIDYRHSTTGLPADPEPASTVAVTSALHPTADLAVYDAPGGTPRAVLPSEISGLRVTVPIIDRRPGWVAVLVPSVNRRVGWLTDQGWTAQRLHDQLLVRLSTHELIWLRDGKRRASWTVATGSARTPTPLGRTFVMGPTPTSGSIYAGEDALVLGAVPENREALSAGLRDGHTAIHAWYRSAAFGNSVSNGCVRIPKSAQRILLQNIPDGTAVHIVA